MLPQPARAIHRPWGPRILHKTPLGILIEWVIIQLIPWNGRYLIGGALQQILQQYPPRIPHRVVDHATELPHREFDVFIQQFVVVLPCNMALGRGVVMNLQSICP